MREGDVIKTTISRLGAQGDGIDDNEGKPIYVPLALPNEQVTIQLGKPLGEGFQAKLLEVNESSPHRVLPACPHFSQCGGCSVQYMGADLYRQFKRDAIKNVLRQQKLGDVDVRDPIILPPSTRRRITLTALAAKDNRVILGFNGRASHFVVDVSECVIARPELVALFAPLRLALQPWVKSAKSLDVSLTYTDGGVDILITGKEPSLAAREALMPLSQIPSISRISWREAERKPIEPILGLRQPMMVFAGVAVAFPAGAFLQASKESEAVLTKLVLEALAGEEGPIADLFSGIGTFTFPLTKLGIVVSAEGDPLALSALRSAPHQKVEVMERDLFRDPLNFKELRRFGAVVFDPPRAGAQAQCAELAKSAVPVIVAVSCNPATFARDAQALIQAGYTLEWVQPVDQFLWSGHVELVARFRR